MSPVQDRHVTRSTPAEDGLLSRAQVAPDGGLGGVRAGRPETAQQVRVEIRRAPGAVGIQRVDRVEETRPHDAVEGLEEGGRLRPLDEGAMELEVEWPHRGIVEAQAVDAACEREQRGGGLAEGRAAGEADRLALEGLADEVPAAEGVAIDDADAGALPGEGLEESLVLEPEHGLEDGGDAHPEGGGDVASVEEVAGADAARFQPIPEGVVGAPGEGRGGRHGESRIMGGALCDISHDRLLVKPIGVTGAGERGYNRARRRRVGPPAAERTAMTEEALSDDTFARFAVRHAAISWAQMTEARALQASCAQQGETVSLPDAMVRAGVIDPARRDDLIRRIRGQKGGGAHQLQHYRLVRQLGEGGMGIVYLAVDTRNDRQVALKVLPRRLAEDAEFMGRFYAEAQAMIRLNHENLVRAYATGRDRGHHFFVMEYCDGVTLDVRMAKEGMLPWKEVVRIVIQVARGLKHAHDAGFVHRDIKPTNIMLLKSGGVKILDMGLTKRMESSGSFASPDGTAIGTPDYIAPEQAHSVPDLDGRADIYALGATLFHVLTGRTPFPGNDVVEVLSGHFHHPVPDPRLTRFDLPEGIVRVIRRMMEKQRENRYPDCGALIVDLTQLVRG